MSVAHRCDRCGKIIENQKGYSLGGDITAKGVSIVYERPYQNLAGYKNIGLYRRELDLCDECLRKVIVYAMNNVDEEFNSCDNDIMEAHRMPGDNQYIFHK